MKQSWTLMAGGDPRLGPLVALESQPNRYYAISWPGMAGPWQLNATAKNLRRARRAAALLSPSTAPTVIMQQGTAFYYYTGPLKGR